LIISHKHKFIFLKPRKVGGTSIEVNIGKHCGKDDIITPVTEYSEKSDEDQYTHNPRNYGDFRNHSTPKEIRAKIDNKIWNDYFKFTIVRNPWDMVVSRYKWQQFKASKKKNSKKFNLRKIKKNLFNPGAYKKALKIIFSPAKKNEVKKINKFEKFLEELPEKFINTQYYFDSDDKPLADFYIRFEKLEEDYKKVCGFLGIPYNKIPRLKSKHRKKKEHYSKFFNDETVKMVGGRFKKEIDFFNYRFEAVE
jgi:hypothetical protein